MERRRRKIPRPSRLPRFCGVNAALRARHLRLPRPARHERGESWGEGCSTPAHGRAIMPASRSDPLVPPGFSARARKTAPAGGCPPRGAHAPSRVAGCALAASLGARTDGGESSDASVRPGFSARARKTAPEDGCAPRTAGVPACEFRRRRAASPLPPSPRAARTARGPGKGAAPLLRSLALFATIPTPLSVPMSTTPRFHPFPPHSLPII